MKMYIEIPSFLDLGAFTLILVPLVMTYEISSIFVTIFYYTTILYSIMHMYV